MSPPGDRPGAAERGPRGVRAGTGRRRQEWAVNCSEPRHGDILAPAEARVKLAAGFRAASGSPAVLPVGVGGGTREDACEWNGNV